MAPRQRQDKATSWGLDHLAQSSEVSSAIVEFCGLDNLTLFTSIGSYLLTYDAVTFNSYLETILASSTTTAKGTARQHQSSWLFMDAANVIFHEAKRRVFIWDSNKAVRSIGPAGTTGFEDDEAALRESEGASTSIQENRGSTTAIPPEVVPVLEENPKWHLLREVLDEIEQEIHFAGPDSCKFWRWLPPMSFC